MGSKPGITIILMALLAVLGGPAKAHPGGLNAEGRHNNRKTGDYHCHRSATPSPQRSHESGNSILGSTGRDAAKDAFGAFQNCSEARAAGRAPIRRGEPGFGPHLDRDGDGIGCEPYRGR